MSNEDNSYLIDGKYSIRDLINLEELRKIFENFSLATGFTIGFLEHPSLEILIATGWRDICTKFHRICPESVKLCLESNIKLIGQLKETGQLVIEECGNGLLDCATPIIIKGKHIATLATGQVLLKKPDIARFKKQAKTYGYDTDKYLEALNKVQVVSEKKLKDVTSFLSEIAVLIAELGLSNLGIKENTVILEEEIVERKQAEKKLQESEQRYKELADLLPQIVFETDENGKFTFVNRNAFDVYGYTKDDFLRGAYALDMFIPEDRERVLRNIQRRLNGEKIGGIEYTALRKDGTTVPVIIFASPIIRENNPVGLRGIVIDITERKQAEEMLKLNESRMEALLKLNQMTESSLKEITNFALEEAIRLTGSKIGYLSFMNEDETVLTMHSWSKTAMEECKIMDKPIVYPVETTGLWGEAVRQRKAIITNDYTAPNPWKKGYPEGHVKVIRHMNVPIFDENHIVIVAGVGNKPVDYNESDVYQLILLMEGMWRIIKHKQAEESLQEREEAYSMLFNGAADLIAVVDITGNLLDLNKRFTEESEYSRDEMIGKNVLTCGIITNESIPKVALYLGELLSGREIPIFEIEGVKKSGGKVPYEIRAVPLFKDGKIFAIQAILRNITIRKQAEDEIKNTLSLLRATIESTADGILVVNRQGKIVSFNQKFIEMWHIPQQIVESRDDDQVLSFVLDQLKDPEGFLNKVRDLYANPEIDSYDEIKFKDGKVFERYSQPQRMGETIVGRVWNFRDVTDHRRAGEEIKKRVKELEEFYDIAVGRELRMKELKDQMEELKKEIDKLNKELGKDNKS